MYYSYFTNLSTDEEARFCKLVQDYEPALKAWASRFTPKQIPDVEAYVLFAFYEAYRHYDNSYKLKFSTYAKHYVYHELLKILRKYRSIHEREISMPDNYTEDNETTGLDSIASIGDFADEIILSDDLQNKFKLLTEKQKEYILLIYIWGYKPKEIAAMYHVSVKTIYKSFHAGLAHLRYAYYQEQHNNYNEAA